MVTETRKSLEKTKTKYFETSKSAKEFEKTVIKVLEDNEISMDEKLKTNESLLKLRNIAENNCQLYKLELNKSNKIFDDCDKKYYSILEKLRGHEESRTFYIKFTFEKYALLNEEFITLQNEYHNVSN